MWVKAKGKTVPSNARLIAGKSGIAKIKFRGDAGVSTPVAALAQYRLGNTYFCVERFAGSKAMFFSGQRIRKPAVIHNPGKIDLLSRKNDSRR